MDRFTYLFNRYISKNATDAERSEFQHMLQKTEHDTQLNILIDEYLQTCSFDKKNLQLGTGEEILKAVFAADKTYKTDTAVVRKLWYFKWYNTAVAVVAVLFGLGLFYFNRSTTGNPKQAIVSASKLLPGTHSATLTLANGKKIRLTDALNGKLAEETGVTITKAADGQLIYTVGSMESGRKSNTGAEPLSGFNTLSTAKGETYQVRLPDGTKVWLNAASSLKYPANFATLKERERRVVLQGEAYFEVAPFFSSQREGAKIPFIVTTISSLENGRGGQEVYVLGTHFNINAYADEPVVKTTLLEGSIKVSDLKTQNSYLLKPNQQAILSNNKIHVENVEATDAIAWKEGYFMFDTETMESAMNKIARWYNVSISYSDPSLKSETLFGTISRYENVSKVIVMLERTKVFRFQVSGRTITVFRNNGQTDE